MGKLFLTQLNAKEKDKVVATLVNLETGETKWKTPQGDARSVFSTMFSLFNPLSKTSNLTNEAKIAGNTIYSLFLEKLVALDRTTGELKWTSDTEYTKIFPTQNGENVVVINSKGLLSTKEYLNVLDGSTGKSIWDDAIKTKHIVYLEDWGTKILVAYTGGFNFYTLADGKNVWKKDASGSDIKQVIAVDNDYLYVAGNDMMLINRDGQKQWKKPIEISDKKDDNVFYLGKVDDKVLYLTSTYSNLVDYKTGKKVWKGNLKFDAKRPLLYTYDEKDDLYMVYNDDKLYEFNTHTTDKPNALAKIKVNNEKEINSIEMFDWGIAITGPTEVLGINKDGSVKYHDIYSQPGDVGRALGKAFLTVTAVAGYSTSAVNQIEGSEIDMVQIDPSTGKELSRSVFRAEDAGKMRNAAIANDLGASTSGFAKVVGQRFNAMKQTRDYAYIFSKDKDETVKLNVLAKVRKEDGKEVDKIVFENMHPRYQVDPVNQAIYYIHDNDLKIFISKK